ncbi:MAG: DoxX family protein, partial [Pseudomonadota bacterium]
IALLVLALPTGAAGTALVLGVPALHESFAAMNFPVWFGYFIGAAEVAGAIGVLVPRLSALAAAGLLPIMLGATYYHIVVDGSSSLHAVVLVALCIAVIVLRSDQALWHPFQQKDK